MTLKQLGRIVLAALCGAMAGCGGGGNGSGGGMGSATLTVSQMSLHFGSSAGTPTNPTPASLSVTATGSGSLSFTAASDSPWLSVTPANGSTPGNLQVSVTLGSLSTNTYTGHVTITFPGAQGSPATVTVTFVVATPPANSPYWSQWGRNPQHTGMADVAGQNVAHALADIVYDPFVTQEKTEINGAFGQSDLLVHYQAPLTDGNDVYMMTKMGNYMPCSPAGSWFTVNAHCGPNAWDSMIWCETRFTWMGGNLVEVWDFQSDWKPEPDGGASGLRAWEPVFHAVDANNFIYVPGAGGTIWKVNKTDGSVASHINPFNGAVITAADTYVAGPLTADAAGNIYYNVIELADPAVGNPWTHDIQGAWLVKVTPADASSTISYAGLVPGAPAANATTCPGAFGAENPPPAPPWPPSTTAVPATQICGS
jgi:BACON domain-containing protein